ncbi:unnamed protein product [Blepharisma stoltei]|uniref:RING-type domain-containing protein n=1 Tax=Blepharisma stoltei TaxID=1481888 RepID=A0AAU9IU27_9CILI|nr:unnamed protein product [Blepharisma stoltei]
MGCFCPTKVNVTQPIQNPSNIIPLPPNPLQASRPPLPRPYPPIPKPHIAVSKIKLESRFTVDDIKTLDNTPASTQKQSFPYNCPICFKFLSVILVTKCCKNYICHYCINELQNKHVNFEIACPHCKAQPLCVTDVDPGSAIKKYSDSPYISSFNAESKTNKWVADMEIVEEDKEDIDLHPESFIVTEDKQISNVMYSTA